MATPRGLTRKITRRQALSYQRSTPNAIGVTAISSVNGRGARARAIRETRSARTAFESNRERRPAKRGKRYGRNQPMRRDPFRMVVGTERQEIRSRPVAQRLAERAAVGYGRALRPLKKAGRAAESVIDAARGGYARAYKRTRQLLGGRTVRSARIRGVPVVSIGAETVHKVRRRRTRRAATKTERTMKRRKGKRRTAAQRRAFKKMQAGLRRWKAAHGKGRKVTRRRHGRATAAQLRSLKKARRAAKKWRLARGYKGNKRRAKRTRSTSYGRLPVKIGRKTARTYLYRTRRGGVKHIPLWAESGARSARQFAAATRPGTAEAGTKAGARIRRRVAAVMRARQRSAARVARAGDIFTPNRGRAIPFSTWSESMRANKKRKRKSAKRRKSSSKLTPHQRRVRAGKKAWRTRKAKKLARAAARRKGGRKVRRSSKRRYNENRRRRHARRFDENRRRRRRARPNRRHARRFDENRRRRRHARRRVHENRRRRHVRRFDENRRRRYLPIRVPRMHFDENLGMRANRRRRHYRRNAAMGDFWKRFVGMLKIGLLAGAGFMGHRALTKILSNNVLSQVPQLQTGQLAPYKDIISGVLVAGAGMFAVDRFAKKQAPQVNAGIFVSLVQSVVVTVLTQMNQPAIAAALSGYPDAEGRAYRGFGEYMPVSGFGDLPTRSRYGGSRLSQAQAGFGLLSQAAAGYGVLPQLTQASAGVGEYMAQNLEGVGDYEMVSGVGSPELTDEGIRPDLASAEAALDIAEAAAGLGDIGTRSQLNPATVTQSVAHQAGGMRSGVFIGGDGVFSK